ncbi:acyl-CoA N-acyltransferase [Aspergillus aurantiobrunneus]
MPPDRRATRRARAVTNKGIERSTSNKPKPLPLVERTNELSREEFISLYISPSDLTFEKQKKKEKREDGSSLTVQFEERNTKTNIQDHVGDLENTPETQETNSYELSIYTASTIPTPDLALCFKLIEETSSTAYKNSSMSWSPSEKRKEMKLPDMKYMVLRRRGASVVSDSDRDHKDHDPDSKPGEFAGFLEFMVTYEDGYEVLYCYEIHLMPGVQGQGVGEELMGRFEKIGRAIGLEKAMLTVFKSNNRAITFYTRVGYTEDESSPQPRKLRNGTVKEADYLIMSKKLR